MSKNCLIIPVHQPKAKWLLMFLNSVLSNRTSSSPLDFDLVIATSNSEEQKIFVRLLSSLQMSGNITLISIDDYIANNLSFQSLLDRYRANAGYGIVNIKKFVALHWVMEAQYDWAACIDCDAVATADLSGIFDTLSSNYNSAVYFGAPADGEPYIPDITPRCRELFSDLDQIRIKEITHSDVLYPWFFDIPIYQLKDMRRFFDYMAKTHGSLENWFTKLKWGTFDHILFIYWRCLNGCSTLVDYHTSLGISRIPEFLGVDDIIQISHKYAYFPIWMSAQEFYAKSGTKQALPNLRLLYHFDRAY